jgi:hypothetical protein
MRMKREGIGRFRAQARELFDADNYVSFGARISYLALSVHWFHALENLDFSKLAKGALSPQGHLVLRDGTSPNVYGRGWWVNLLEDCEAMAKDLQVYVWIKEDGHQKESLLKPKETIPISFTKHNWYSAG